MKHLQWPVKEWVVTFNDGTTCVIRGSSEIQIRETYKFKGVANVEFTRMALTEKQDSISSRFD
jgi:hypothetical protein